ncbi:apelin receptor A-like [Numenius arquata]|uniref:apelin receptor A-like n=1 Tax=Numenius arquata TaxID=31919 RepID=UPI003D30D7DE
MSQGGASVPGPPGAVAGAVAGPTAPLQRRGVAQGAAVATEYGEAEGYCYGEETTGNGTGEACERQADWEASFSLLPLLYLLVFALGLSGNGLTVWRGPPARRRSADAYIGNLALADLAFVAALPLWAACTALRFHWPFGAALRKLSSSLVLLSVVASAFCLGGLSAERRRSPAGPGPPVALWAAAAALPAPLLREARRGPRNRTLCELEAGGAGRRAALSLGATALGFAAPPLLLAGCCCCVAGAVRRRLRPRRAEAAARLRLRRLMAAPVAVFAGCWLPFHLLESLFALAAAGLLELPCALLGLIARPHPCATCLAYLHSRLNPLLYAFLDGRFRARCRLLLGPRRPPAAASSTLSGPTQRSEVPSAGTELCRPRPPAINALSAAEAR